MDYGITEAEFWDMTLGELNRAIESKQRIRRIQAQERASYDYILADLIGASVARIYSSKAKMPNKYEVYPKLFEEYAAEDAARTAQQKAELSFIRFKQFAIAHNERLKQQGAQNNNE